VAQDAGTLVPLVCKLVAQSLLLRERSSEDERFVIISLKDAGQALQQQAHAVHAQAACATQCTLEQREALTVSVRPPPSSLKRSGR
jgi:DNA-binding MarR family transcriptional regulator